MNADDSAPLRAASHDTPSGEVQAAEEMMRDLHEHIHHTAAHHAHDGK